jgi:nucleoside-diphosphate-sugar epimerase
MVGSAILRRLESLGYSNVVTCTRHEFDLLDQNAASVFFDNKRPEYVFLAAAKVYGIFAGNTFRKYFIIDNLVFQTNILAAAIGTGVTTREPTEKIADVVGFRSVIQYDSRKQDGTPRILMDVSRLNHLGWYTKTSILEGIKLTYKAFLESGGNDAI